MEKLSPWGNQNEQYRTQAQAEPRLHPQADPRRTQAHAQARAGDKGPGTSLGQTQAFDSDAGSGTSMDPEILMLTSQAIYPIVSHTKGRIL